MDITDDKLVTAIVKAIDYGIAIACVEFSDKLPLFYWFGIIVNRQGKQEPVRCGVTGKSICRVLLY